MSNNFYFLKINGQVREFEFTYDSKDQTLNPTSLYTWNHIRPEQFLSVSQIVDHEFERLSVDEKTDFSNFPEQDLIQLHHEYGRWIRNSYGLWHPGNPFVIPGDPGDGHPDGLSMLVIKALHKLCNTPAPKTDAFEDAMTIIVQEKK